MVFTNLAVGTHLVVVGSSDHHTLANHIHVMITATGTVAVDYTFDPGDVSDGVAAPSTDFAAGVNQILGQAATASAVVRINGPVTAILLTVVGSAVNIVTIAA
jgi:hypothetical protein